MFLEALQLGRTYVQLRICLRPWVIYTRVNTGYDSNKYGINTRARKFKISVQKFSYFEAHLKSPWPPTAWSDQLLVWGFKRNLSYGSCSALSWSPDDQNLLSASNCLAPRHMAFLATCRSLLSSNHEVIEILDRGFWQVASTSGSRIRCKQVVYMCLY